MLHHFLNRSNNIIGDNRYSENPTDLPVFFVFCAIFITSLTSGFSLMSEENKSPRISRTLLSILTKFNSAVVWMISILLLISSSSNLFSRLLRTAPTSPTTICITAPFRFHSFSALKQNPGICPVFRFAWFFALGSSEMAKSELKTIILTEYNKTLSSGLDWVIRLLLFYSLRVFHTSVRWWSIIGV